MSEISETLNQLALPIIVDFLVPKLCLGTRSAKLCFASTKRDSKQSFETCVPKQSLGTRDQRRAIRAAVTRYFGLRHQCSSTPDQILMDAEKENGQQGPTNPEPEVVTRCRRPGRFGLESWFGLAQRAGDSHRYLPFSFVRKLELGRSEQFVGCRFPSGRVGGRSLRLADSGHGDRDLDILGWGPGGRVLDENAHVHPANTQRCRRREDGDPIAAVLLRKPDQPPSARAVRHHGPNTGNNRKENARVRRIDSSARRHAPRISIGCNTIHVPAANNNNSKMAHGARARIADGNR